MPASLLPDGPGDLGFLSGGGQMGALTRAHDWASTPLGPVSGWPQSLRSVLSACLTSPLLGAVLWGEDLRFLYNDAYIPSLADRHPWALGRPVAEVWGEAWAQVSAPFHDAMRTGVGFAREQVALPMVRDGRAEITLWNFTAATIRGEDGGIAGLLNQGVEITGQVRNAEALQRSQDRLSAALAVARLGTFEWDLATNAVALDARARELYGLVGSEDIDVSQMFARIDPADIARVRDDVAQARRAGTRLDTGYRVLMPDGTRRDIVSISNLVVDAEGKAVRVVGVFEDLTERRDAARRLRDLNRTLERRVAEAVAERKLMVDIVDTTTTCIQAIDADYRFLAINKAAVDEYERIYGVRPKVGDCLLDLLGDRPVLQANARAVWAPALRGGTYKCAQEFGDPRIACRHYDLAFEALRGDDGTPIGAFMTGFDITDRMRDRAALEAAREALRQSQKMEAVGKLTGGIAHDFNNMLAVVIGSLDMLGRRIGAGDAHVRRYVDAATDGARRAALLTQRLLAFSRQQPLRPEVIDVNRLVAGMSELIRGSIGADIRFETVLADGGWRTHADPHQLENVLLNLAVNARDAMPEGGRLTVETRHVHLEAADAGAAMPAGDYVLLNVTDTGIGMSTEVRDRAFDPFFTTKAIGKGTGLGLSQVYGFVAQSGGHVGIESVPGCGTTLKVWLPRLTGPLPPETPVAAPAARATGAAGETILVVEDEPLVRQWSVDALTELGYRVLQAEGAATALQLLEAHPEIALLFTDVVMPDVNGRRLADLARQQRPALKVLFTTGYASDGVFEGGVLDAAIELIHKPFTVEGLADKVRELLDA